MQKTSQKLHSSLRSFAGSAVYTRGRKYYKNGHSTCCAITKSDDRETLLVLKGSVKGSHSLLYDTSCTFDTVSEDFISSICSCPYAPSCKHAVSLGILFIDPWERFIAQNNDQKSDRRDAFLMWHNNTQDSDHSKKLLSAISTLARQTGRDAHSLLEIAHTQGIITRTQIKELDSLPHTQKIQSHPVEKSLGKLSDLYCVTIQESLRHHRIILTRKGHRSTFISRQSQNVSQILSDTAITKTIDEELLLRHIDKMYTHQADETYSLSKFLTLWQKTTLDLCVMRNGVVCPIDYTPNKTKDLSAHFTQEATEIISGALKTSTTCINLVLSLTHTSSAIYHKFIADESCLFVIENTVLSVYSFPSRTLHNLFVRLIASQRGHRNTHSYKTSLTEDELIKLPTLLDELTSFFDLTTEIKGPFTSHKHKTSREVFAINYSARDEKMFIAPAIDYGFCTIATADTVNISHRNIASTYTSKSHGDSREKYALTLDMTKQEIHYSPLKKELGTSLLKKIIDNHDHYGFTRVGRCSQTGLKEILHYHKSYWTAITKAGYPLHFLHDTLTVEKSHLTIAVDADLNADNNWLAFDTEFYCGKDRITLEEVHSSTTNKDNILVRSDGTLTHIENSAEVARFLTMLESFQKREDGTFEGVVYNAPEFNALQASDYYKTTMSTSLQKFLSEAKKGVPVDTIPLPPKLRDILRDYQGDGVNWFHFLQKYHFGGILADDMGLGKTLQALTLLTISKKQDKPSIIICPKTLLYNWQKEAKKFVPTLRTCIIDGKPEERTKKIKESIGKIDLIITSYSLLQKDIDLYKKHQIHFYYCILDEAQTIKNHRTKNAHTVKQVDAQHRLALTGTPLENSVSEIWAIFDFLMPGFLGSQKAFTQRFLTPIMKNGDTGALEHLRTKIACFMLRRSKAEVLTELPPKIETVQLCPLSEEQNILYQEVRTRIKSEIFGVVGKKGFQQSHIHILAGLTKLRQACNHPSLLLADTDYTAYPSTKLSTFHTLVENITKNNGKVLVFSQFTSMLDILAAELTIKNIGYTTLTGRTIDRQKAIDDFQTDPNKNVFLISLRAGGVGLNLTAADNVIIFDPWWNPSVENQAIDRAHRIGQTKSVNVYRLITTGTIEEKIIELQGRKKGLSDAIIGESKDLFTTLTWDDVQKLFD